MILFNETSPLEELKSKEFVLVVGMPGIGSVGKIVIESLREQLEAELVLKVYFDDFPSQVIVDEDGKLMIPRINVFKAEISSDLNFLLLTGDFQPTSNLGIYNFVDKLMKYLINEKKLKIQMVLSTGAYVPERNIPMHPKIFISGTDMDVMEEFLKLDQKKIRVMSGGIITGANGIIPAWCELLDIPGICLLGETIPMLKKDIRATKTILEVLKMRFDFDFDFTEIEKQAKDLDNTLEELKKRAGISPEEREDIFKRGDQSYIG
ncbi:MAG: PAC2 family protein [Candidatus Hodarchaeota archaeon]